MRFAAAAIRILGALSLGLGISAVRVVGVIQPDPSGLLVPVITYGFIGGAILTVAPPTVRVLLLVGWVLPWLLVG